MAIIRIFASGLEILPNFRRYVDRMGGFAPNCRCTLPSFLSVDICDRFAEEFLGFVAILLCSGVSRVLVEVDGQNFSIGFSVAMRINWAKRYIIADLAHGLNDKK